MKITAIRQQVKQVNRYSVYVDEAYSFSLSETALLESGIASGQELDPSQVAAYKQLSSDDKLYNQALRYVAARLKTTGEVSDYLTRKKAPDPFIEQTLNKLSNLGLLDDERYARSFVHDRQTLKPTSRQKLIFELRRKKIATPIIEQVLSEEGFSEKTALQELVERKRRQTKYQDDQKLMQYLARQGFRYDDIKSALSTS